MDVSMPSVPLVFPIRFATQNAAVQTTTRELSARGVFVRCLEPPAQGTSISMKLYLPGRRDGLEVQGVVREVMSGGDAGFWAEFQRLGPAEEREIGEMLARRERAAAAKPIGAIAVQPMAAEAAHRAQPAAVDDARRSFPRVPARFAVRFGTVQDFVLEYAANISAGGVFVQSEDPLPLNSIIRVEMELPGGGAPVPARAVVVHRVTREEANARGVLAGMGVQFMDADDEFRQRIDAAIELVLSGG
jgi:type IV pilus assembly protein PilZ